MSNEFILLNQKKNQIKCESKYRENTKYKIKGGGIDFTIDMRKKFNNK